MSVIQVLQVELINDKQYRYQLKRLYVLIALEKARPMDTAVSGDGLLLEPPLVDLFDIDFLLLIPFLLSSVF